MAMRPRAAAQVIRAANSLMSAIEPADNRYGIVCHAQPWGPLCGPPRRPRLSVSCIPESTGVGRPQRLARVGASSDFRNIDGDCRGPPDIAT